MAPVGKSSRWGCVTGRFQPFHLDHLQLVNEVVAEHGRVIVAITNAEPSWRVPVADAPHRHLDGANPFTYWQRAEMIHAALLPMIDPRCFRVVPFPLHNPEQWDHYVPLDVDCWVRDRGPWEASKHRVLSERYAVRLAPRRDSEVSGTEIRRLLTQGDPAWEAMVPEGVVSLIKQWQLEGTLSLTAKSAVATNENGCVDTSDDPVQISNSLLAPGGGTDGNS
jgi:nicotinamide-nucleotide adenylyltransferase